MNTFLAFELKVAALMAVFYLVYQLALHRNTWFGLRRRVLLASAILSLLLPCCVIKFRKVELVEAMSADTVLADESTNGLSSVMSPACQWLAVLMLVGMVVMAVRLLVEFFRINRYIGGLEKRAVNGRITVALTDNLVLPFSYRHYVVMSHRDYQLADQAVMLHEQAHVRHHHTADFFLVNMMLILQWFNPFAWLLRKEIAMVHEYEADEDVVSAGVDTTRYMQLLMDKATKPALFALANTFSGKGMLRLRFEMMAQRRSSKSSRWRILWILPVVACSLAMTAQTVTEYKVVEHPDKNRSVKASLSHSVDGGSHLEIETGGDSDSVVYYVNQRNADKKEVDKLDPKSIRQVKVVKTSGGDAEEIQPVEVFVDLNDTVVKKVDDDVYEIVSDDDDAAAPYVQAYQDALKKGQQAKKEAQEAREKVAKKRELLKEKAAKAKEQAKNIREKTEKLRDKAVEKAKQERERLLKESKKDVAMAEITPVDSVTIPLIVNADGIVANVDAYRLDSLAGDEYVVIVAHKGPQKRVVRLYKV